MESILEYMASKHQTLANDYKTPDGNYSESCGLIAIHIAKILSNEGKKPSILVVEGRLIDKFNRETITPRLYQGRIKWGAHQVCYSNGLVYDPMVEDKPVAIDDYCQEAFSGKVEMNVLVPQERINSFLKR
ncbi:MAG: hypothetical protein Q7S33_02060 [Nanoarchaeota archaeon]|nr:hypothetical protein [Nanoarchaeota archaeon]